MASSYIKLSSQDPCMKLYRAVYRGDNNAEYNLDLFARSLAHATSSANELIPRNTTLVRVFFNPDW